MMANDPMHTFHDLEQMRSEQQSSLDAAMQLLETELGATRIE